MADFQGGEDLGFTEAELQAILQETARLGPLGSWRQGGRFLAMRLMGLLGLSVTLAGVVYAILVFFDTRHVPETTTATVAIVRGTIPLHYCSVNDSLASGN